MRFRRAWIVLVLGLIGLAMALITGREMYYRLTYLLFAILLISATWAWSSLYGLRLRRYTRAQRAQMGRVMEEQLAVKNTSWLPKLLVVVRDQSSLPGHHASRVVHGLGASQEFDWLVRTLCEERGEFHLGPVTISGNDPLGLFERQRVFPQTSRIVVYPAVLPVGNLPPPRGPLPGGDALRRRTHYITPNAAGVRDYVPGDSFARIHWASTARLNRLIVKEFELDPMSDVWIFLDMEGHVQATIEDNSEGLSGEEDLQQSLQKRIQEFRLPPSTEEYAIAAAASVANAFIQQQYAVGLVAYGQRRELVQPDREKRQQIKLLETLAILHAEGEMPFSQMLNAEGSRLTRGTTAVIISPSTREDWAESALYLHSRGLRILAIVVDAASFGGPDGSTELKNRLLTASIPAVTVRESEPLAETLNTLSISPERAAPV
jgi:uncharacterized protein (DUF58 family)